MNKLGKRDYIKLIADSLVDTYGNTLKEDGTDVEMANGVVNVLKDFLYFHPQDMSHKEFLKWKKDRRKVEL